MTREEAKHFWPIIKAYSEGKTIEYLLSEGKWATINEDFLFDNSHERYRIKQEPSYRPFKSQDECWREMHNHSDFGWVKHNYGNVFSIMALFSDSVKINECDTTYSELCEKFKFMDGTPFGILEK